MNKKTICLLIALLLLLSFPLTAMAEDDNGTAVQTALPADNSDSLNETAADTLSEDEWLYEVDEHGTGSNADDTAILTGYTGTSAVVTTPPTLGGHPVTAIDDDTFYKNDIITTVTVSEGVEVISGFYACNELTTVNLPSTLKTISAYSFYVCRKLQSITLPEGLEEIGQDCFNWVDLKSVTIPASVKSIGVWCFDVCLGMQAINVDAANSDFKSVDGVLFNKSGSILYMYPKARSQTGYTIPEGVETILTHSFNRAHLTQITLPQSLVTIDESAFDSNDFVSITIPKGVQNIGQLAFSNNNSLEKFIVYNDSVTYDYDPYDRDAPGALFLKSPNVVMYGDGHTLSYAIRYGIPRGTITTSMSLDKSNVKMYPHISDSLAVTTTPAGGYVTWSSSDPSVASVDSHGVITANALGTATITATSLHSTATCLVTVVAPDPIQFKYYKKDVTFFGGADGSISISITAADAPGYEYSIDGGVTWQQSCGFTGLTAGTYTVTVRNTNYTYAPASCSVTIEQPAYMGSVPASKIPAKVNAGNCMIITPPAPPKGYTVKSATYSSNKIDVAVVDASGRVTFLAGGKVTIIANIVSQSADKLKTKTTTIKKTITVRQPVSSISLNVSNAVIARTQKIKLISIISPIRASDKKVTWKSSNPKVAVVSGAGVVTGKAGGTAVITCTAKDGSGATASCTVNVTPVYPTGIKLSKAALTLKAGKAGSLKATLAPKNTDFKAVTWASSNTGIVSVDASGKLKAMAPGTAVITATTSSGQAATCTVTVN